MDIKLYINLQNYTPPIIVPKTTSTNIAQIQNNLDDDYGLSSSIHIFYPLTVKLIMVDHFTHYIHDIFAQLLENIFKLTNIFPWLTANFISFTGLFMSIIASKLLLSDKLFTRRIGCILFELRNFGDSLDGYVYRSRVRKYHTYESVKGTLGYNVDVICDGLGGFLFMLALLFRHLRSPPLKSTMQLMPQSLNACNLLTIRNTKTSNTNLNDNKISQPSSLNVNNSLTNPNNNIANNLLTPNILNGNDENDDTSSSSSLLIVNDYDMDNFNNSTDKLLNVYQYHNDDHIDKSSNNSTNNNNNTTTNRNFVKYSSKNTSTILNLSSSLSNTLYLTKKQVKLIIFPFGFRILFTGLIWDHFVNKYQILLQNTPDNELQRETQLSIFKSFSMWIIMWFWRVGSACAILEHLTVTTFMDITWEYMMVTSVVGWLYLILLTLFTEIHYVEAEQTLMKAIKLV